MSGSHGSPTVVENPMTTASSRLEEGRPAMTDAFRVAVVYAARQKIMQATGTPRQYEAKCWQEYDRGELTAEQAAMKAHRYWLQAALAGSETQQQEVAT